MAYPLVINNLSYKYNGNSDYVLNDINMTINPGEINIIVGPKGSGKSTLCNCISGIIPHVYKGEMLGDVELFGRLTRNMNISDINKYVGTVFQNPDSNLFSYTVENNMNIFNNNFQDSVESNELKLEDFLRLTCMELYKLNNPDTLQSGQKQLVALSTVLSLTPEILILDEIMEHINEQDTKKIKNMLIDLKKKGKSIVMVENDLNNILIADNIFIIENGKIKKFEGLEKLT